MDILFSRASGHVKMFWLPGTVQAAKSEYLGTGAALRVAARGRKVAALGP